MPFLLSHECEKKYVLLAVEEFTTQRYESETHSTWLAIANVVMSDITTIDKLYGGHFVDIIIVPEENSMDVDNIWSCCSNILKHKEFAHLNIMAPCIITEQSAGKNIDNVVVGKRKLTNDVYVTTGKRTKIEFNQDGLMEEITNELGTDYRLLTTTLAELKQQMDGTNKKYKLGYHLGADKVTNFMDFYMSCFNQNRFIMAKHAISFSAARLNSGLSEFVMEKLENIVMYNMTNNTGKKTVRISGKKTTGKAKHVADDVAVAVVMSVILFPRYASFRRTDREALVKLV